MSEDQPINLEEMVKAIRDRKAAAEAKTEARKKAREQAQQKAADLSGYKGPQFQSSADVARELDSEGDRIFEMGQTEKLADAIEDATELSDLDDH
jgi:hypothetical protein